MKHIKLVKSLDSGLILGELIETVQIENRREFVVQNGTGRMFVKDNSKVALIAASSKAA